MIADISGLDKVEVFKNLYANAKPLGLGMLHFVSGPISNEEANYLVKDRPSHELYFDYVKGRVMKVNLAGDSFDSYG